MRKIIALTNNAEEFLQPLLTVDVSKCNDTAMAWSMLLTPQGKIVCDFFLWRRKDTFYIDCHAEQLETLVKALAEYRMGSDVQCFLQNDMYVHYLEKPKKSIEESMFLDPRMPEIGYRLYNNVSNIQDSFDGDALKAKELENGIACIKDDVLATNANPMEAGLKELNGVTFEKGCFVGQEVITRIKYKGLLKRRFISATWHGERPDIGATISDNNGNNVGETRTSIVSSEDASSGIVMCRLSKEAIENNNKLKTETASLNVKMTNWLDKSLWQRK